MFLGAENRHPQRMVRQGKPAVRKGYTLKGEQLAAQLGGNRARNRASGNGFKALSFRSALKFASDRDSPVQSITRPVASKA
jgi:hypothetical protein